MTRSLPRRPPEEGRGEGDFDFRYTRGRMTDQPTDPRAQRRATRFGLFLFFIYLGLYAGFMGLSAFAPRVMASTPFGGINLAIWYGIALILAALLLALLYMFLCREGARDAHGNGGDDR